MAQLVPNREPTHAELRALAISARLNAHELRREARELVARCVERRIVAEEQASERSRASVDT